MATLNAASLKKLNGVHPHLISIVKRAAQIYKGEFVITCGVRTVAEQRVMVRKGASQTMNSRHIPGRDGFSHAVDLAPTIKGVVKWDWPLFYPMADAMKQAAKELGIKMEWGGDWKKFKDGPHFQLPNKEYP